MGTYYRGTPHTGAIECFLPDDNDNTMYITSSSSLDLKEILRLVKEKWSNTSLDNIEITAEHIHTDCIGYDCYDASDYTDYVVITKNK